MRKVIVVLLACALLSGCADTSAYIRADKDSDYKLSKKTDKIIVVIDEKDSVRTREFGKLLIQEMKTAGFNVVDNGGEANVILTYSLDQKTTTINSYKSIPTFSTTRGTVSTFDSPSTATYSGHTTGTAYVPTSDLYTVKQIYITLYSADEVRAKEFKPIWEAYLGAGDETFDKNINKCVAKLLSYYGENYKAHTDINH